ncbi:MAG: SMC-Scp complex subunit ScpB [Candidatus Bathyarchaeota archaeon]|nr:SMC-Scp complex subunit ScpB [Candidatus Bathyarchaeota archaeon]
MKNQQNKVLSDEELKRKKMLIEAALYAAGYPLELKTLCSITQIHSKKKVYEIVKSLIEDYASRESVLEVVELENERFVMQLKPQYVDKVRRLSLRPLLTEGPLKTLSYIAYRQPVALAKVITIRGRQAYEHIRKLLDIGFISREKIGKTYILRTTETFSDYFNLSRDQKLMKKQLEVIFSQEKEKFEFKERKIEKNSS